MRSVSTGSAPAAIGPYSQAVECNGAVFVSGQLPVDPMTGEMPDTPAEQARRALENVRAIVESSGCTMADCVKVTIYLTDLSAFAQVNEVYKEFFAEPYPARSCMEVSSVPKGAMLEIDAIAIRSS